MTLKNKYANRSKISEAKIRQIVKLFTLDLDASQITKITDLNRNTINRYLSEIRTRISEYCETQSPFSGEVEVDGSFFGARRVKGKRGREAFGKTIVLESSNEVEKFTQKLSQIVEDPYFKRLYEVESA